MTGEVLDHHNDGDKNDMRENEDNEADGGGTNDTVVFFWMQCYIFYAFIYRCLLFY